MCRFVAFPLSVLTSDTFARLAESDRGRLKQNCGGERMWLLKIAVTGLISTMSLAPLRGQSAVPATAAKPDWNPQTKRGALTIWRVVAVGPARPVSVASLSPEVKSHTSGSFGQPAGSFGRPAGDTGQATGSFGQTAGSFGQTAGSFGQTAGSLGESTDTLADAAAAANGTSAIAPKNDTAASRLYREFEGGHSGLDGLAMDVEEVGLNELQTRLGSVAGTRDAPDVLVGTPLPQVWADQRTGLVRRFGLVTLGVVRPIAQTESGEYAPPRLQASILLQAPHPGSAREFIKWLSDRDTYHLSGPLSTDAPSLVARNALGSVLLGRDIGSVSDQQMAVFNSQIVQQDALGVYGEGLLNGLRVEVDQTAVRANDRFALVEMRAVMENRAAFGVAHAVVVLRMDETGQWRVLQLTPNLAARQQRVAADNLYGFAAKVRREEVALVTSAALAAPVDGDNRSPVPEFWWDNRGAGTLEVVEWQKRAGDSWNGSNLYFVPEDVGNLRTRTTGRFADAAGVYRWRVWSLGRGGSSAISGWRTVNILPQ